MLQAGLVDTPAAPVPAWFRGFESQWHSRILAIQTFGTLVAIRSAQCRHSVMFGQTWWR
jgi:hypothetical protein